MTDLEPASTEELELAKLEASNEIPPRSELPAGVDLIAGAIASLNNGVNGLNPYITLLITNNGDGTLNYILEDRETLTRSEYIVSISPVE